MLLGGITAVSAATAAAVCILTGNFQSLVWLWVLPVTFAAAFLACLVLTFLFVWAAAAAVKMDVPQEKDSSFYRQTAHLVIDAAIKLLRVRIHTQGLEKTPKEGRFLLVCNHLNDVDPAVLLTHFRKSQLAFISKRENDQKFIIGPFLRKILCQPINRENDREALKTILRCIQLLKDDVVSIAVFPEGYIHDDHKLHHFRSGVFKIAQKANVPIVVCTLRGTPTVLPNAMKLKPSEVHLHLLDVIPARELKGVTTVELGNRIYEMMAEDLGPELVSEEA